LYSLCLEKPELLVMEREAKDFYAPQTKILEEEQKKNSGFSKHFSRA
jgi:hypothetical protein